MHFIALFKIYFFGDIKKPFPFLLLLLLQTYLNCINCSKKVVYVSPLKFRTSLTPRESSCSYGQNFFVTTSKDHREITI